MTLDAYLSRTGAPTLTELAGRIGVSKGRLSQLRHKSELPPELALAIERETIGEVSASDLSSVIASARKSEPSDRAA